MSYKAQLEGWVHQQWSSRGLFAWALSPLSLLYMALAKSQQKKAHAKSLPVPVVVVGNIYVGGTGKTPVTMALVRALAHAGFRPGIISRGFGRHSDTPQLVTPTSLAKDVGDEPLLICQQTGVPVAVGSNRWAAGMLLLQNHPEVDVILSDDGLQHRALARDVEIAVVGARGLGNGWVLPAGPLREGPSRLDQVDAVVLNTQDETIVSTRTPRYVASSCFGLCHQLATDQRETIDALAQRIQNEKLKVMAAAGIASPGRFFAMVRAHDIDCVEKPLGDHFDFATNPFKDVDADLIFITAKDAVKCVAHPELKNDPRLWVVELEVELDPYLIEMIVSRVKDAQKEKGRPLTPTSAPLTEQPTA